MFKVILRFQLVKALVDEGYKNQVPKLRLTIHTPTYIRLTLQEKRVRHLALGNTAFRCFIVF